MNKRCLFGKRDDLHAYAECMAARARELMASAPLAGRDYGPVVSALVHRDRAFQTELFTVAPGTHIPTHRHPGVDSIECPVAGFIRFTISGKDPYERVPDHRLARFALGKLVRINAGDLHSGVAGPHGARFLSMQRWADVLEQGLIGERWVGATVSDAHSELAHGRRAA